MGIYPELQILRGQALILASLLSVSSGFICYGWDSGIVNAFAQNKGFYMTFPALGTNTVLLGAVFGFFVAGNCLGAIAVSQIGNRLGRRDIIFFGNIGSILGLALQTAATNLAMLIAARLILGAFCGLVITVTPPYVAEISPAKRRGWFLNSEFISANIGLAAAYWIAYAYATEPGNKGWRIPSGLGLIWVIITMIFFVFAPESPRYFVEIGQEDKALDVLTRVYDNEETARHVLAEIHLVREKEHSQKIRGVSACFAPNGQCFRYRMLTIIGVYTGCQALGIALVTYYAGNILSRIGLEPHAQSLCLGGLGIAGLVGTVTGVFGLIEFLGRVKSLILGALVCGLAMIFVAISTSNPTKLSANYLGAFGMFLYFFAYSATWLPLGWTYTAELTPLAVRTQACAIGQAVLSSINFLIIMVSPTGFVSIGWKLYIPFIVFNYTAAILIWMFCPETGKLPLEHIDRLFVDGKVFMRRGVNQPIPESNMREVATLDADNGIKGDVEEIELPSGGLKV